MSEKIRMVIRRKKGLKMKDLELVSFFKIGLVALASGTMVVGGILLGSDSSGQVAAISQPMNVPLYSTSDMPAYPGSIEYPVGEDLQVNGVPIRLSYYYTKDSVDTVGNFYIKSFRQKGLDPQRTDLAENEVNIYALSNDGEHQFNISIVSEQGQTIVFPSVISVTGELFSDSSVKATKEIPFSEDAVGVMKVASSRENGSVVSYFEPKFDLLTGVGYIRDSMGKKNWEIEQYNPDFDGHGNASIKFRKGNDSMIFGISKVPGRSGVAVSVNSIQRETNVQKLEGK